MYKNTNEEKNIKNVVQEKEKSNMLKTKKECEFESTMALNSLVLTANQNKSND